MNKTRLPKAYTDEQLNFLRNHIGGFESRSRGHVRGDAKKFALDRANEFLVRFGMPEDLQDAGEAEPRFREQIYNWYKNTTGRARRRLEGRTRSKKAAEQESPGQNSIAQWGPNPMAPTTVPYAAQNVIVTQTASLREPPQQLYQRHVPPLEPTGHMQFSFQTTVTVASASTLARNIDRNPDALRDAFLTRGISAATLSSLIQSYVLSHPSPTALNPIIDALFAAVTSSLNAPPVSRTASTHDSIITILRRFTEACEYFPTTLVHAGVHGPLAGPRALQMAIRKSSVWFPISAPADIAPVSDEVERIAADRKRGKDHIQWAQIHGAALELGLLSFCDDYVAGRTGDSLSELMARDAVWGADEVEWVAGISVLRSVIRTGLLVRKHEYEQLLSTYEGRWNEIEDERRQAFVTEVLLSARQNLARMDEGLVQ
ncbi:hypothetical protein DEU56DRAFT_733922 [Suillus clintonianus]|uniref:uncharacterized protein n=1 Tax=Suillus clintonianus TaxID=1904413 RepID=UPI001B886472|nr:uncharacterized protein DEU56DRAFT_733922 [Suillus clintonianus]KAG2142453.1 hypothetical protein DEU56DRAFT_733922 [Suillus clintonianus]